MAKTWQVGSWQVNCCWAEGFGRVCTPQGGSRFLTCTLASFSPLQACSLPTTRPSSCASPLHDASLGSAPRHLEARSPVCHLTTSLLPAARQEWEGDGKVSGQRVPLTASSWGHRHTGPPLLPGCVPCTSNPLISPSRGPLQGALGCRGPGTPEESGFTWPPARPKPGPVGLGRLGHDRSRASQPNQRLDRRTDRHRPPRQAPPLYFLPCFICLDCPQVQGWGEVHFCPFQISVHQKHPKPRGGT